MYGWVEGFDVGFDQVFIVVDFVEVFVYCIVVGGVGFGDGQCGQLYVVIGIGYIYGWGDVVWVFDGGIFGFQFGYYFFVYW